jgi:hypothetical protein
VTESHGLLLTTAFATAGIHTLIPEHWLPVVLVGRREGWTLARTMEVAGLSGLLHIGLSLGLGAAAFFLGEKTARSFGSKIEPLSHVFLIVFGLGYILYDWTAGHGRKLMRAPDHDEAEHLPPRFRGGAVPWVLASVVGLHPCVLAVPVLAAAMAVEGLLWVVVLAVFSLTTVATLLLAVALGYKGAERLHFLWLERYGGLLSGGLIAAAGLVLWLR